SGFSRFIARFTAASSGKAREASNAAHRSGPAGRLDVDLERLAREHVLPVRGCRRTNAGIRARRGDVRRVQGAALLAGSALAPAAAVSRIDPSRDELPVSG